MSAPNHVFNTWLIAHILHPFLWWLFILFRPENFSIEMLILSMIIGVIASIPALFICMGILMLIKKANWPILLKGMLWGIALTVMVLISFIIVIKFVEGNIYFSEVDIIFPALCAVMLSFCFRLTQLTKYLN